MNPFFLLEMKQSFLQVIHRCTDRDLYLQLDSMYKVIWPAKLTIFAFYESYPIAMKFKTGDRVNFLNETGGGTVSRIDDRGLVYVLTEDGFEIPVTEKELVISRNFTYAERDEEAEIKQVAPKTQESVRPAITKQSEAPEPPANLPADAKIHLLIGFVPERPGPVFSNNIRCYLINDSPYFVYFFAGRKESGIMYHISSGLIESDTKSFICTFDQTTLSKISHLHVQALFVSKGRYSKKEPADKMINLNLVNFSKESYYRENDYFDEKAVLFEITGESLLNSADFMEIPDEIKELKTRADKDQLIKPGRKEPDPDSLEVDLHFDELASPNSRYTPSAILALQLSRFHAAIEEAISKNIHRLVIIHGLGQGTLRMQIRKELQEKYPNYIYQDASFKEYGFGATMVHLTFDQKQ